MEGRLSAQGVLPAVGIEEHVPFDEEDLHRALGFVPTPPAIVHQMVRLAQPQHPHPLRILEPACADCRFLIAFRHYYGIHHQFTGVELNPASAYYARQSAPFAHIIQTDYLLWTPDEPYDVILGNPPYGIIGNASHYPIHLLKEQKQRYKQRFTTIKGKYNIYGLFVEHSVRLLKPNGILVFLIPASWMVLDDFERLRAFLAEQGRLSVYRLGKVFSGRNVDAVILKLEKGKRGLELYDSAGRQVLGRTDYGGELIRFETPELVAWERSGVPLGELFEVHFAARSPEFKRNRWVVREARKGYVPVLTGRNLGVGVIDYERCYSGLWMPRERAVELRAFYGFPHLVVGHTKGTRVVCAVDERCYPWREEFHLVPRSGYAPDLEVVCAYLNSDEVQQAVEALYRDLVPHLTRTMLERIPIPLNLVGGKQEQ